MGYTAFAPTDRQIRVFDGAQAGLEKNLIRACWDGEGKRVAAGGGEMYGDGVGEWKWQDAA